jgi:ElaB/YqjD/DUF883 family membrane-anchored ribosome-binding protein
MPMTQSDARSLQAIKRETEQTRANLTETVEQLRSTVSETANDLRERIRPDAIKAEVSQYVRSRGEQFLDDLTTAARENPMQAVAVGASVAYPLLRVARAIPVPILMIGAGLFFAGSKTGQSLSHRLTDAAADRASAGREFASEHIDRLNQAVSDGTDRLSNAAEKLQDKADRLGASVADRAAEIRDQGTQAVSSAVANVQDVASSAAEAGRRTMDATKDASLQAARRVRETASDLQERVGSSLYQTIEQNPLLVAGAGLLVGALIASALPRSNLEVSMIGEAGNAVKRGADAAAARGIRDAKDAVSGTYDEAARQAKAEGLAPEGVDASARDIGQRLKRVAEAAVTTAFEPPEEGNDHQKRNNEGETDHG